MVALSAVASKTPRLITETEAPVVTESNTN